jgi:hypothetical protein
MPAMDARHRPKKTRPIPKHAPKGAVEHHAKLKAERRRVTGAAGDRPATPPAKADLRGGQQPKPDAPIG